MVINQWDREYVRCPLDDGVPWYGRWVSEVEDLGWGISHVGNRLGGKVQRYKRYHLFYDKNELRDVVLCER